MINFYKSVVIFDGTTHFVESSDYKCQDGEKVVYRGNFDACSDKSDELNAECKEKRRR
jgi:hypothetical protein